MTNAVLPDWVVDAMRMPVAFAQVREDSLLDLSILERIGGHSIRGLMVASGGCTAAALISNPRLCHLHLVDINPAQIALCRLKVHLLQIAAPLERMRLLGHSPMESRDTALAEVCTTLGLPADVFGPRHIVAQLGPDHVGRYELLFARLRREMRDVADQWTELLNCADASTRSSQSGPCAPLGRAMDEAFDRTMDLRYLTALFGAQATQNCVEPFSRHFAGRTRNAIAASTSCSNPYLWQLLIGRFPESALYPWLTATWPDRPPNIVTSVATFDEVLGSSRNEFDFVHLSDILDWLSPDEAQRTLELARGALRLGGLVHIRQLNSALDLPVLVPSFDWLEELALEMHASDRSFFYRRLHVGRKR
jgi:S-adenosylmethionine-diacylglycerol 3-amino-3-carboxypropyl transferase